jgi:TolA-binding protein
VSPKAMQYKPNSIIFFKGDASDRIFVLQSGQVSLNYTDIETGQEIHDPIRKGEFFGVRSALGRYAREETAQVLTDTTVVTLTVPEFEQLALQNTRLIVKMLRVFSNILRRIHKQVQNLIYSEEQIKPEEGLYRIGEYYMKNKRYSQALYAYRRYLTYYPSGTHAADANHKIQMAEDYLQRYGQGKGPGSGSAEPAQPAAGQSAVAPTPESPPAGAGPAAPPAQPAGPGADSAELSAVAKQFYNAVSLLSQQKYQEAMVQFRRIAAENQDPEYTAKSQYEMGRCLFHLKQHDAAIQSFSAMIQRYPKHPDLREALFYVGKCYEEKGEQDKAKGFYNKILSLVGEEDSLSRRVRKSLKDLGGGS